MKSDPLVVWLQSPPYVEAGAFGYLERNWTGGVVYAFLGELREERVKMGWVDAWRTADFRVRSRGSEKLADFVEGVISEFPTAMHLVGGLSGQAGEALRRLALEISPEKLSVVTERPGAYGPLRRRLPGRVGIPIKYWWLTREFRSKVGLLLPLGRVGRTSFLRLGWHPEQTYSLMYCPMPPGVSPEPVTRGNSSHIRFLYVGRLSRYTKGTDIMMKAVDRLRGDWSLSIVGGHGDLIRDVESWASEDDRISFLGAADPEGVKQAILNHDVCVVPSRFDGWNVVVNEAISLGRGVIVTDQAVSHELVETSGSGLVVPARSPRRLAKAMQLVVDTPSLADDWSRAAVEYAPLISPEVVGAYLMFLLQASRASSTESRVIAPWLTGIGETNDPREAQS